MGISYLSVCGSSCERAFSLSCFVFMIEMNGLGFFVVFSVYKLDNLLNPLVHCYM